MEISSSKGQRRFDAEERSMAISIKNLGIKHQFQGCVCVGFVLNSTWDLSDEPSLSWKGSHLQWLLVLPLTHTVIEEKSHRAVFCQWSGKGISGETK